MYREEYHAEIHLMQTHRQVHGNSHQHSNQAVEQNFHASILIPWRPVNP